MVALAPTVIVAQCWNIRIVRLSVSVTDIWFFSLCLHLISPTLILPTVHKSHFAYIFAYITKSFTVYMTKSLSTWACTWVEGGVCKAFSLSSTPSSVVTDPPHFLLTAHLQYLNLLRLRTGVPLVSLVPWTPLSSLCCQSLKALLSHSYPYVGEMIHICRQNESRRTEM